MARIQPKPIYTEEFRNEALNLLRGSDGSIREVAESLGVSDWTLRTSKRSEMSRSAKKGKAPPKPPKGETPAENVARLERELAASRKEIDSLRTDREILKKQRRAQPVKATRSQIFLPARESRESFSDARSSVEQLRLGRSA